MTTPVSGPSAQAHRGARFEVLGGLGVFVLVQMMVALLVEGYHPTWRNPLFAPRVEDVRTRLACTSTPPPSVLFLGSSRFQHGVCIDLLETTLSSSLGTPVVVFNHSVSGAGCQTSHLQWSRLHAASYRPNLVLVDVVPSLLDARQGLDSPLRTCPVGELDWEELDRIVAHHPASETLHLDNALARAFPLHGHRQVITSRLLPRLLPTSHLRRPDPGRDLTDTDVPLDRRPAALQQAAREHGPMLADFRLGAHQVQLVEALLADLRGVGVGVLVVVMPEGPVFRSWYRPGAWNEVEGRLQEACTRHGARLICARDWFGEEAFFDSHHLTRAGGRRFSARLAEEVLVPGLRRGGERMALQIRH